MSVCLSCGACCAAFRVCFPSDELRGPAAVPAALTEEATGNVVCMRGTTHQPPRCVALRGEIGRRVHCFIHDLRPSVCRDFAPLAALGQGDAACSDARRRHGLPPLGGA